MRERAKSKGRWRQSAEDREDYLAATSILARQEPTISLDELIRKLDSEDDTQATASQKKQRPGGRRG